LKRVYKTILNEWFNDLNWLVCSPGFRWHPAWRLLRTIQFNFDEATKFIGLIMFWRDLPMPILS